ncbi:MAG: hypothetical protein EOO16_00395 [Chitinophagaceae bacterium]|nr:MAG: hypothetical protein EOO16_00395 [Chitinophagaceae bacterium]
MKQKVPLDNDIVVAIALTPKKNRRDQKTYDIYYRFVIYEGGVEVSNPVVYSTGQTKIPVHRWKAGTIDSHLSTKLSDAAALLRQKFVTLDGTESSAANVRDFIRNDLYSKLTYNGSLDIRGQIREKHASRAIETVLENFFAKGKKKGGGQRAKDRKRNIETAFRFLNTFYQTQHLRPLISIADVTRKDLEGFKEWLFSKPKERGGNDGKKYSQNSIGTYLDAIAAVFNYAADAEIISKNPLPKAYSVAHVPAEIDWLEDHDIKMIINLDDSKLASPELRTKYIFLVEVLTGMPYCDLQTLQHDHLTYSNDFKAWKLCKPRKKTGVLFEQFLSKSTKYCIDKLREIAPGSRPLCFQLPSLSCTTRQLKALAKRAGVAKKVTTYVLRHTYAVKEVENETSIPVLQKKLGHKDYKSTSVYANVTPRKLFDSTTDRFKIN